jgi:hypothetical protein
MGRYFRNINARGGPPPGVSIDKVGWKTKVSRKPEDTTFVLVEDERILPGFGKAGVFDVFVRSSNHKSVTFGSGWPERAIADIEDRLNDNCGSEKGRVLYAVGLGWTREKSFDAEVVLGALTYHIPESGEVRILSLEATRDIATHRSTVLELLLLCAERVALECSRGRKSKLTWEVSQGVSHSHCTKHGFREMTTTRAHRVILRRDGDPSAVRAARHGSR